MPAKNAPGLGHSAASSAARTDYTIETAARGNGSSEEF